MISITSISFNKFLQMGAINGDAELDEEEIAALKWDIPFYRQLGLLAPASPPGEIFCETCDEMASIYYSNGVAKAACPNCGPSPLLTLQPCYLQGLTDETSRQDSLYRGNPK